VRLDGGGIANRLWHDTSYGWRTVDLTADRASWTWEDVASLRAEMTLDSHPNGRRDSDVWADSFRIRVGFRLEETGELRDEGDDDDGAVDDEPEECDGGCEEDSDWWWGDPEDGTNADGAPDDDVDELDGYVAEDDEPAWFDEDEEPEVDGDDDPEGDEPTGDEPPFDASELQVDGEAWGGGSGGGCGAGVGTATLLPLALFGLVGPLRRRRETPDIQ